MNTPYASNPFEGQDSQMAQLFSALSPMVQESIIQCGVKFNSAEDLQKYAENLTGRS